MRKVGLAVLATCLAACGDGAGYMGSPVDGLDTAGASEFGDGELRLALEPPGEGTREKSATAPGCTRIPLDLNDRQVLTAMQGIPDKLAPSRSCESMSVSECGGSGTISGFACGESIRTRRCVRVFQGPLGSKCVGVTRDTGLKRECSCSDPVGVDCTRIPLDLNDRQVLTAMQGIPDKPAPSRSCESMSVSECGGSGTISGFACGESIRTRRCVRVFQGPLGSKCVGVTRDTGLKRDCVCR